MRSPSLHVVGLAGLLCVLATMLGGSVAGSVIHILRFGSSSDIDMVGWPLAWCIWAGVALILTFPSLAAILVMAQWHGSPHRRLLRNGPGLSVLLGGISIIPIGLIDMMWIPWLLSAAGCLALTLLAQGLLKPRRNER